MFKILLLLIRKTSIFLLQNLIQKFFNLCVIILPVNWGNLF